MFSCCEPQPTPIDGKSKEHAILSFLASRDQSYMGKLNYISPADE